MPVSLRLRAATSMTVTLLQLCTWCCKASKFLKQTEHCHIVVIACPAGPGSGRPHSLRLRVGLGLHGPGRAATAAVAPGAAPRATSKCYVWFYTVLFSICNITARPRLVFFVWIWNQCCSLDVQLDVAMAKVNEKADENVCYKFP